MLNRYYRKLYGKYYGADNIGVFLFSDVKIMPVFFVWSVSDCKFKNVILIVIGLVNSSIDNSVSDTIKRSGKISVTKNIALPERNIEITIVATNFENGHV